MDEEGISLDSLDQALSIWDGEDLMSEGDLVTDINDGDIDEEVRRFFPPNFFRFFRSDDVII
jgi:hypothetical protein